MKYDNTAFLRAQFAKDNAEMLVNTTTFDLNDAEFHRHLLNLRRTSKEPEEILRDRAAYRCLTHHIVKLADARMPSADPKLQLLLTSVQQLSQQQREFIETFKADYKYDAGALTDQLNNGFTHVNTRLTTGQMTLESALARLSAATAKQFIEISSNHAQALVEKKKDDLAAALHQKILYAWLILLTALEVVSLIYR